MVKAFRERAGKLKPADCDGDASLCAEIVSSLWFAADLYEQNHAYLKIAPWSFAKADTPEGAMAFLVTATSKPLKMQDDLTKHFLTEHRADLQARAAGAECSASLSREVTKYNDTPLDESPGEGYHRSTNCVRVRARAAMSPFIKQSTRTKQNIKELKKWKGYGFLGKRVLRFEWRRWSRVLQVKRARAWKRKHMKREAVFERVYRMDAMAEEKWGEICERVLAPGQGPPPPDVVESWAKEDVDKNSLRVEYLQAVLLPGRWYMVIVPVSGLDSAGRAWVVRARKYIHLLSLASGKSRPHFMRHVDSHGDLMLTSKLALRVQEVSETEESKRSEDGSVVVYPDSHPHWLKWSDLGPWVDVFRTLSIFSTAESLSGDNAGCLRLSGCQAATSPYDVTDSRCPTLMILFELHKRKWRFQDHSIIHESGAIGDMDGRESCRMKKYFMVLIQIDRCIALTSSIPSDEYVIFYELLLAGIRVEPGLSMKRYRAIKKQGGGDDLEMSSSSSGDEDYFSIHYFSIKTRFVCERALHQN